VTTNIVKTQLDFLKHVHDKLNKITTKKTEAAATENWSLHIEHGSKPGSAPKQFAQRLLMDCFITTRARIMLPISLTRTD